VLLSQNKNPFNTLLSIKLMMILLLLVFSFESNAYNFAKPITFKHITVNEGLSQNYVYSVAQDQQGFIWIATQDGLNRYDGENVVQYRHNSNKLNSIPHNFIRKVFVDDKNTLWVGTQHGLSRYNRVTDSFENYFYSTDSSNSLSDNVIWDIYQNAEGTILISTETGLHKYNTNENYIVRIRIRGFENHLQNIKTIYQDQERNYWLGTYENGIYIANSGLTSAQSLQSTNEWQLAIDANALYDIKLINNDYWLATDQGIYILDKNYQLKELLHQNSPITPLLSNQVRSIVNIDNNNILIGTENGLNIYNINEHSISEQRAHISPKALSNDTILDIYQDDFGKVWLGTLEGMNYFSINSLKLTNHLFSYEENLGDTQYIAESPDGTIWFSSLITGLTKLDQNKQRIPITTPFNTEGMIIHANNNNQLFLQTFSGELYQYLINENEFIHHTNWLTQSNIDVTIVPSLINDELWFVTIDGNLKSYNTLNQNFAFYEMSGQKFISLFNYKNNELWLSSKQNSIVSFDITKNIFSLIELNKVDNFPINAATQISISDDWIWLGTMSQGLAAINRQTKQVKEFNEKNGLLNNYISGILLDEKQHAWLSSNGGLSYVNPENSTIKNFSQDYGLDGISFLDDVKLKSSNNHYYFGGIENLYQFYPDDLLTSQQQISQPIFTNLYIKNKVIEINGTDKSGRSLLKQHVNESKQVILNYQDSPFSIEFISPNNTLAEQVKYRYKLIGLDDGWIDADIKNHRATYTNLSANNYTFVVEAYDLYQPKLIQRNAIDIKVLAPWWLARSAIIVYILTILSIIAYFLQQLRYKQKVHIQIKKSEERLKLSLWGSGDEMWDWNIQTGKIYRSNIWGILEFPQDGERNIGDKQTNIHPSDIPRVRAELKEHFAGNTEHFEVTYRVKDKNERWVWILDRGKIVEHNAKNEPSRMTGTLKDISMIKKAEERLKLFAKCIENISDAIIIYDRKFITVDVNKAFQTLTQKTKQSMIGKPMNFTRYSQEFNQNVKKHLLTQGTWNGEIKSIRKNGDHYLTDLNIDIIRDEHGKVSHFVGVFSDITERKKNELELITLANTDTLTGLPNRANFQINQTKLVNNKIPHALLVFDLDNFKKINDSMGHELGDVLLCKVAERLLLLGRKADAIYRLGGDEFSLIIHNTNDIHTITSIAKDVLHNIALPMKLKNQEIVLYSSIGVVLYPEDGSSSQELLKNADTAMYHAKGLGGNKYQFFNESMNKQAVKRLQIENLIRQGLKEDFFTVFYQPKINIASGKVSGMEALVRFQTPTKGIISPGVFIPVSEETGQIVEIGEVVLRKACFATKKWIDSGFFDGRVAVNLSAVQFSQPNLASLIAQILLQSGLPAKHLELEITEGTVMDSPKKAIETMLQIRSMGINLSLDDFGTGYSSLSYLKKFPLNTLKIDKAFVDDIEESSQGRNMVATIVTIAHNLELDVVAEGVETENQLKFLATLGCEQMQGYLYSKPLSVKDFGNYLLSHQITDKSTSFKNMN
jgi:diguanylate cyclase (GGDEF)-like protein/PAS domain S-box-containing protein